MAFNRKTDGYNTLRAYTVPGKLVRAGCNVIAVRVVDTGGGIHFSSIFAFLRRYLSYSYNHD